VFLERLSSCTLKVENVVEASKPKGLNMITKIVVNWLVAGADPGFQVRGAHFKKLRRAEGGAKMFWVFRVKNHDFTPKNLIFFQF
jgi:hypothetical protein